MSAFKGTPDRALAEAAIIECAVSCEMFLRRSTGWQVADSDDYIAVDKHSAFLFSREAFRLAALREGGAI